MTANESLAFRALSTLLRETLLRADDQYAYVINPGERGFVETLKLLSAETASTPPGPGRRSIVAHASHVLYGIELANRALGGEEGVFEGADWNRAWQVESVSEDQWRDLVSRLEAQSKLFIGQAARPREWSEDLLTGAFEVAAHTAYHLGAVRQMLLDVSAA
jgi:hypothetical protein